MTGAHGRFVGFGSGTNCDIDVELCPVDGAFYSDDGVNWSAAAAVNNAFTDPDGRTVLITAVTPYVDGFVATGSIVDHATESVVGGVWVSEDGAAWTAVDMPPIELGSAHPVCEGTGHVFGNLSILAAGSHLVAFGFRDGPKYCHPHREYFALGSADGTSWQPVAFPDLGSGGVVSLQGGRQFVIVTHGDGDLAIWTSVDGASWKKGSLELPQNAVLYTLVETPDGYLAFAERGSGSSHSQIVLGSTDGLSGELLAEEPIPIEWEPISRAARIGDSIVVLGSFGYDPAAPNGGSPISGVAETTDGLTWTTPETDAFSGYYIWSLIFDGTTLLINGEPYSDPQQEVLFVKSSW